jgi:hypothetical protein
MVTLGVGDNSDLYPQLSYLEIDMSPLDP